MTVAPADKFGFAAMKCYPLQCVRCCDGVQCELCDMRALFAGRDLPVFDESVAKHLARCHPEPEQAARELFIWDARLVYGRPCPDPSFDRGNTWYGKQRWKALRARVLKEEWLCAECRRRSEVVDHIERHRGDKALFFDRCNLQALCTQCHNKKSSDEAQEDACERKRMWPLANARMLRHFFDWRVASKRPSRDRDGNAAAHSHARASERDPPQ